MVLFSFANCKENKGSLKRVALNNFHIDTSNETGLFKDIIPFVKNSSFSEKETKEIYGYFVIDEINKMPKKILVKVYSKAQRKYIKIDTDRDGKLDDEIEYSVFKKSNIISIPDCKVLVGGEEKNITLFVKPMENTLFKPKTTSDVRNVGLLFYPIQQNGEITIRNSYIFSLYKYEKAFYAKGNAIINIKQKGIEETKSIRYKLADEIYLDREVYSISSVDSLGRFIDLRSKGITKKNIGYLIGDYALEIQGNDVMTKKNINLSNVNSKLILLDFWGTWCTPCLKATDELIRLSKQYENKLSVLGIACDYDSLKVEQYLSKKKISYANIFENYGGQLENSYVVREFPTYILLDADKKIIFRGSGFDNFLEVKKLIENYLSK